MSTTGTGIVVMCVVIVAVLAIPPARDGEIGPCCLRPSLHGRTDTTCWDNEPRQLMVMPGGR
jgi:hypothetical protein